MADTDINYTYWREELKGIKHSRDTLDPIWGRWRIVGARTKPDWPFAVWGDASGTLYKLGRKDAILADSDEGQHMFAFQWPHAIAVTSEEYNAALLTGYWSDGKPSRQEEAIVDERPKEGQSNYAPAHEVITERINQLIEKIDAILPVTSQEQADKATELGQKLKAAITEGEALFSAELAPAQEVVSGIKLKWDAVKTGDGRLAGLRAGVRLWLAGEAARRKTEAEAAAAKVKEEGREAEPAPEPERPKAQSAYGRAVTLSKRKVGKITDMAKFLKAVKDDQDVLDLLQKKANALARAGTTKPGMIIEEVLG